MCALRVLQDCCKSRRTVLAVMEKKYCACITLRGTPQPLRCITPRWNHASVLPWSSDRGSASAPHAVARLYAPWSCCLSHKKAIPVHAEAVGVWEVPHLLGRGGEVLVGLAVVHRHAVAHQVHVPQPVLRAGVVVLCRRSEPAAQPASGPHMASGCGHDPSCMYKCTPRCAPPGTFAGKCAGPNSWQTRCCSVCWRAEAPGSWPQLALILHSTAHHFKAVPLEALTPRPLAYMCPRAAMASASPPSAARLQQRNTALLHCRRARHRQQSCATSSCMLGPSSKSTGRLAPVE